MSTKHNPNLNDDEQMLGIRIQRAKVDRLREIAAREERKVSAEVRWLIERRIAEVDQETEVA